MVPTPWPSAMVALVGLLRLTKKVSFGFGEAVAVDQHGDRPAGLAGGNRQRAGGGLVVAAGRGGAVGGGVGDGHRLAGGRGQGHGEGGRPRAGVAFRDCHVADGQQRLAIPLRVIRPRDVGVDVGDVVDGVGLGEGVQGGEGRGGGRDVEAAAHAPAGLAEDIARASVPTPRCVAEERAPSDLQRAGRDTDATAHPVASNATIREIAIVPIRGRHIAAVATDRAVLGDDGSG